jgi:hypothetical protein
MKEPVFALDGTRWLASFCEALTSPTRDDGSSKSEPRKLIVTPIAHVKRPLTKKEARDRKMQRVGWAWFEQQCAARAAKEG